MRKSKKEQERLNFIVVEESGGGMKGIGEGNKPVGRQIPIEIIRGDVITRMSRLAAERARGSTTRKKRFMESHISPILADNQIV